MSWRELVEPQLKTLSDGEDRLRFTSPEGSELEIEVRKGGPIGSRLRELRLRRAHGRPVGEEVQRLCEEVRGLPERLTPIEVDERLQRGTLRTSPGDMRRREFFEVDVSGERDTHIRRQRVGADGQREAIDWDMTHEQLGDFLDSLDS